ncbi:MAG: LysM peptidoglycan-binding domain-containing protein [Hyphomicrobiaceae bacterium]|nr:LysM peptidoglycan-binding domain-containing protein [Hyphomicrobiaceae bacterium]
MNPTRLSVTITGAIAVVLAIAWRPLSPTPSASSWQIAGMGAPVSIEASRPAMVIDGSAASAWLPDWSDGAALRHLVVAASPAHAGDQASRPPARTLQRAGDTPADTAFSRIVIDPRGAATFEGTGPAGAEVVIMLDGKAVAATKVGSGGRWQTTLDTPLPSGEHRVATVARDASADAAAPGQQVRIAIPGRAPALAAGPVAPPLPPEARPASARPPADVAIDPALRQRAEELARAASERFTELSRAEKAAAPSVPALPPAGADRAVEVADNSAAVDEHETWLSRASRVYRETILPGLSEPRGLAEPSAPAAGEAPPRSPSGPVAPVAAPSPSSPQAPAVARDAATSAVPHPDRRPPDAPAIGALALDRVTQWLEHASDTYARNVVRPLRLGGATEPPLEVAAESEPATPALSPSADPDRLRREAEDRARRQAVEDERLRVAREREEARIARARQAEERARAAGTEAQRADAAEAERARQAREAEIAARELADMERRRRAETAQAETEAERLARIRKIAEDAARARIEADARKRREASESEAAERARLDAVRRAAEDAAAAARRRQQQSADPGPPPPAESPPAESPAGTPAPSRSAVIATLADRARAAAQHRDRQVPPPPLPEPAPQRPVPYVVEQGSGERGPVAPDADEKDDADQGRSDWTARSAPRMAAAITTPATGGPRRANRASQDEANVAHTRADAASAGRCRIARAGRTIKPPGTYIVQSGDTLWSISARHYASGRLYTMIVRANRGKIRSARWIYPCQRFYLPRRPSRT